MFDNFTDSSKELIYEAQNLAMENHNTLIEPVHILYSMTQSTSESIIALLSELKLNNNLFNLDVKNQINNLAKTTEPNERIYFSKNTLKLFEIASEKTKELKDKFTSPEHLFLALFELEDSDIKRIKEKYQGRQKSGY